ncbi:MAG: hypothetical protein ACFN20_05250 [Bacteroidota bacterium]
MDSILDVNIVLSPTLFTLQKRKRATNTITLSANEEELMAIVKQIVESTELDKFCAYSYGVYLVLKN